MSRARHQVGMGTELRDGVDLEGVAAWRREQLLRSGFSAGARGPARRRSRLRPAPSHRAGGARLRTRAGSEDPRTARPRGGGMTHPQTATVKRHEMEATPHLTAAEAPVAGPGHSRLASRPARARPRTRRCRRATARTPPSRGTLRGRAAHADHAASPRQRARRDRARGCRRRPDERARAASTTSAARAASRPGPTSSRFSRPR